MKVQAWFRQGRAGWLGVWIGVAGGVVTPQAAAAQGSSTATVSVEYQVDPISVIQLSGAPPKLTITAAQAGSAPTAVSNATTTWAVTNNVPGMKVVGELGGGALPLGVSLYATLQAPTSGGTSSTGAQKLINGTAKDLITGIGLVNQGNLTVTWQLEALTVAGVVSAGSRQVTLTILSGS